MRAVYFGALMAVFGGVVLLFADGGGKLPDRSDVLGQCYIADRAAKSAILAEMADKEFPNDDAQADWLNNQVQEATSKAMEPFVAQVAQAIIDENVAELAEAIK